MKKALLMLGNGEKLTGELVGKPGTTHGEIVFNTAMTGYQEILTDPSYAGRSSSSPSRSSASTA